MNTVTSATPISQSQVPSLLVSPDHYGLLTDLYQLTMGACYAGEGLDQKWASFELTVRKLPTDLGYLIAMGLTQAIEYLQQLRFTPEQISALQATGLFERAPERFWELLRQCRFTGDVWAVPEGTAVFAHEPLLRVEAPLWQAQLVETYLLNAINYQTLVATRAARLRDVAGPEATLLEFGSRRAFGPQAAVWAARAALAGGLDATSNVLAALELGRKPAGTMAHALVMAITALEGNEQEAFEAFSHYFPGATLLIDTYDPLVAARTLAARAREGFVLGGVRLDSGDLVELSRSLREILPPETSIFASGDLDEFEILRLRQAGACIQGYGVGTRLVTGSPVNGVYKLVEIEGIPVMKESMGKLTYPGRKQVFRRLTSEGIEDRLALAEEAAQPQEQPLLEQVLQGGKLVRPLEALVAIAQRTRASVEVLPEKVRQIREPVTVEARPSAALQTLVNQTRRVPA
ncbi:nicotinate phosphoribosyltransferase [Leptolyngbya sp. FACHB-261]|uniref:nicotinate phosphoribosyltransferase n=1 Tax=Leptolyngbya sp. FACHB-261 TaxID=2692806 RepID=UPI00168987CB|nr:nicotinate phosphoribosyltransferase [Leptolyngbya sp. FACHB-261]MBD2102851.1 nicotinate phosphoribosyltransferase [Leptolyngbya sp. FACHB-261]